MEPLELSSTAGGKVEWACPLCKTVWQFLVTSDILLSYQPAALFPDMYLRDIKTCPHKEPDINIAALFQMVKD